MYECTNVRSFDFRKVSITTTTTIVENLTNHFLKNSDKRPGEWTDQEKGFVANPGTFVRIRPKVVGFDFRVSKSPFVRTNVLDDDDDDDRRKSNQPLFKEFGQTSWGMDRSGRGFVPNLGTFVRIRPKVVGFVLSIFESPFVRTNVRMYESTNVRMYECTKCTVSCRPSMFHFSEFTIVPRADL